MREDGVTLIELLVVASIIAILALALAFTYEGWQSSYNIESQVKDLYGDLMDARTKAMTRNQMHFVELNANDYSVYEDTDDDTNFNPGAGDEPLPDFTTPKNVRYTIIGWLGNIGFDTRGIAWEYTAPDTRVEIVDPIQIFLTLPPKADPDFDCILVEASRIQTGKMSGPPPGGTCNAK
jgi:prepilin-type N-terminal cleavage/methylation domain-containing protein